MNISKTNFGYISVDNYKYEGFRSGALIYIREILRHIKNMGHNSEFISLVHKNSLTPIDSNIINPLIGNYKGLDIHEVNIGENNSENSIDNTLKEVINKFSLDVIFIESPSVELRKFDLSVLQIIQKYSKKVIMLIQDELYPNYTLGRDVELVKLYLNEMKKISLISPTNNNKDLVKKTIGLNSTVIPNLLDLKSIITDNCNARYITMINPIRLKGIEIFEEIARRMPNLDFLTVESWKQEKLYESSIKNLHTMRYTQEPSEIYKKTKILLVPSLIKEGGPRVIIEALANNIPVIGHDIGGIKDSGMGLINLIPAPVNIKGSSIDPIISNYELLEQTNMFIEKINEILNIHYSTNTRKIIIEANNSKTNVLEDYINGEIENVCNIKTITEHFKKYGIDIEQQKISFFSNGNRNIIYNIEFEGVNYLCRINHVDSDSKRIKMINREKQALMEIQGLNIGPKLLKLSNKDTEDILILEFIDGKTIDKLNNEQIMLLSKQLSKLHQNSYYNYHGYISDKNYSTYNNLTILEEHILLVRNICLDNTENTKSLELLIKNIYLKLDKQLKKLNLNEKRFVLIHGDLKKENIIVSENSIKFIDWECSHIDLPEIDIARILSTYLLNNQETDIFFKNYKNTNNINIKHIKILKNIFIFLDIIIRNKKENNAENILLESELRKFITSL